MFNDIYIEYISALSTLVLISNTSLIYMFKHFIRYIEIVVYFHQAKKNNSISDSYNKSYYLWK